MSPFIKNDWEISELQALYESPLIPLISQAHTIHSLHHKVGEIQVCSLLSIKTGGCPENCKYCSQSVHYSTPVTPRPLMKYEEVMAEALRVKQNGVTRFCLGAAWREVRNGRQFDEILRMVKGITALGMEVCCTLGMLKSHHAKALKEAGLFAYNHNLDTSEEHYDSIITTRSYQDRINTLDAVENSGLSVCCGGILGIGEAPIDRLRLLHKLCTRNRHPDSVPINRLTPIPGTPMENQPQVSAWEVIRLVAIARIVMPKALVRLSSGRLEMSHEEQALCFLAGANSIHTGEKLLTVPNPTLDRDAEMFRFLGLTQRPAFKM